VPAAGEAFKFVLCTSVNDEIVHGIYRFHRYRRIPRRLLWRFGHNRRHR
jgi:hypothetical protein